jgi:CspA family cold shock protein
MEDVKKLKGIVKWFSAKRGFGFIRETSTQQEYFVHFSGIISKGYKKLNDNQEVEFELEVGPKGMQQCTKVVPVPMVAQVKKEEVKV